MAAVAAPPQPAQANGPLQWTVGLVKHQARSLALELRGKDTTLLGY